MTQTNLASLLCMSGKIWCIAKSDVIQLLLFHHQMRGEKEGSLEKREENASIMNLSQGEVNFSL